MPRALLALLMLLCACDKRVPPPAPVPAPGPPARGGGYAIPPRAKQPEGVTPPPGVRAEDYVEFGEISAGDLVYVKGEALQTQPFDPNGHTLGLLGIKCPGLDEPLGPEALAFTQKFLASKQAWMLAPWKSKTDPAHGSVYLFRFPDGEFLNGELVREGLARVTEVGEAEYVWKLKGLEEEAKAGRVGIWR